MLGFFSQLAVQSYNQTDRIQGMARYMNREGSSSEWMSLLLIFAGMLTVILILKGIAAHNQRKREAILRQKLAKKRAAEAGTKAAAKPKSKQQGRATRLR